MFPIGDSLREARTRRGLSAADVQKGIRIRERYLSALEEERWEMLPGEAYAKGFLRTYAEYLGLDGELYIDEYNARLRGREDEPLGAEPFGSGGRLSGTAPRTLAGALVLATAVAGLAAWRLAGSSTSHGARSPASGVPAAASAPAPSSKAKAPAKGVAAPAVTHGVAVISAARGDSWLSIRAGGPQGALIYEGILSRGATKRFALTHALWVRMGRPNVLDVVVAGRRVAGLPATPANILLSRTGSQPA
jgi:cytoskeleton protein RodZ